MRFFAAHWAARTAAAIGLAFLATGMPAFAQPSAEGITLERPSRLKNLVPAEQLERAAQQQFAQMKRQASEKNALAADDHP
ncbi:MAG: hypothetical protein EBU74_05605, partial [Betaproteobacteria bacterium]|nr:hypothetical protein [Betaproteobacteria bacterium]